jgi:hypothetical protein
MLPAAEPGSAERTSSECKKPAGGALGAGRTCRPAPAAGCHVSARARLRSALLWLFGELRRGLNDVAAAMVDRWQ